MINFNNFENFLLWKKKYAKVRALLMPANMSSLWEEEGVGEEVGRGEGMPHSGLPEIKGDGTGAALNCSPP